MNRTLAELDFLRAHPAVRAFFEVIAAAESGGKWDILSGGGTFAPADIYPVDAGKAAGKFQIIPSTWRGLVQKRPEAYALRVFDPATQERMALDLLEERDVPAMLTADPPQIERAVDAASWTWAGLPGPGDVTRYAGNKARSLAECIRTFSANLVGEAPAPAPQEEQPMPAPLLPILAALLPTLIEAAPKLLGIFSDPKTPVRERNVAAAVQVAQIAQQVTGAANLQAAAEEIAGKATARERFAAAVDNAWPSLTEVGGGVPEARKWALETAQIPAWRMPALWITAALMPLVYWTVGAVLHGWGGAWSAEIRASVVSAVISGVLFAITGFWLGTSLGSQRKTDMLNERRP